MADNGRTFGALGGFASGFADVWMRKHQEQFQTEMESRRRMGEFLQGIYNNTSLDQQVRQRALDQWMKIQQTPPGKKLSVDVTKDVINPPPPPPDAKRQAVAGAIAAATQAPSEQDRIKAQMAANVGGGAPTANVQAPPPPPGSTGTGQVNATGGGLAGGPIWSESLPGGTPNPINTPAMPPRATGGPATGTVAAPPSLNAGFAAPASTSGAPHPVTNVTQPPPPPQTDASGKPLGLFASDTEIAAHQAHTQSVAAMAGNQERLKQIQQMYPQMPPLHQQALAMGMGLHDLETTRQRLTEELGHEPTDAELERKAGVAPPWSAMMPKKGPLVQDPKDGKWYAPFYQTQMGPNGAPVEVEVSRVPAEAPPALWQKHRSSTSNITGTATSSTTTATPPTGGGSTPAARPIGATSTPKSRPTSQVATPPAPPVGTPEAQSLQGLQPAEKRAVMAAATNWERGIAPTGKLASSGAVSSYMAEVGMTPHTPGQWTAFNKDTNDLMTDEKRFKIMTQTLAQIQKNPENKGTFDAALIAYHLGMTMGEVKGMRGGMKVLELPVNARSLPDKAQVALQHYFVDGSELTDDQRQNMLDLARQKRDNSWEVFRNKATDNGWKTLPKPLSGLPAPKGMEAEAASADDDAAAAYLRKRKAK